MQNISVIIKFALRNQFIHLNQRYRETLHNIFGDFCFDFVLFDTGKKFCVCEFFRFVKNSHFH